MLENELKALFTKELQKNGWTTAKLHGTQFQRGLPDMLVWRPMCPVLPVELWVTTLTSRKGKKKREASARKKRTRRDA